MCFAFFPCFVSIMIPRSPNRINAFLYTSTGYSVFFFRDTLMMGFGSGDWYFFRHQVTGRREEGVFYYGPKGTKTGCWATSS